MHDPATFHPAADVIVPLVSTLLVHCCTCQIYQRWVGPKNMKQHVLIWEFHDVMAEQILTQCEDISLERKVATSVVKKMMNTSQHSSSTVVSLLI